MEKHIENLEKATTAIIKCFEHGGKLLVCGNGGSSADTNHFSAAIVY